MTRHESILKGFKEALGEKIGEVSLTNLMQQAPISLIKQDDNPMLAQLFAQMGQQAPQNKPNVEINVNHEIFQKLKASNDESKIAKVANLLFGSALIAEGGSLDQGSEFSKQLNTLMLEWLDQ